MADPVGGEPAVGEGVEVGAAVTRVISQHRINFSLCAEDPDDRSWSHPVPSAGAWQ
jgi:hypothetical protein